MSAYVCAFPGCLYPTTAYGWCEGHYEQATTTGQLAALHPSSTITVPVSATGTPITGHPTPGQKTRRRREAEALAAVAVSATLPAAPTPASEPAPEPAPEPEPEPEPAPKPVVKRYTSILDKVQDQLELGPQCWGWSGSRYSNGSPSVSFGRSTVAVHRYLWEGLQGRLPETARLLNTCGTHCPNPGHYRLSSIHERNATVTPARPAPEDPDPEPEPAPEPVKNTVTSVTSVTDPPPAPIVTAPVLLRTTPVEPKATKGRVSKFASATEKFWSLTEVTDGCWKWQGPHAGKDPALHYRKEHHNAQRFSWELHRGPLDPNTVVTNPPWCGCVNPAHLRAATRGVVQKMHNAHRRARIAATIPHHTWRYEPRPVILPGLEAVMGR